LLATTNNIGAQTLFPVSEGILNDHGSNYLALSLWSLSNQEMKLANLGLISTATVRMGYGNVELSLMPGWEERGGAY